MICILTALYIFCSVGLLVAGFYSLYYLFFGLIYLIKRKSKPQALHARERFLILIPAHDEERTLPSTLQSISNLLYPKHLIQAIVVADNCKDGTAEIAKSMEATCLVRTDKKEIGKGYALRWGIEQLSKQNFDVLVIIDADTQMDPEFLTWMNHAFLNGARVAQGLNRISNPDQSPLTRLMEVTSYLKNLLYYGGKSQIGLSAALMGTGMAFHREIIDKYGWRAFSVGEDWEQTCLLACEGIPVIFVERAKVYAEEAVTFRQGYSQRMRWAGGKFQVSWQYGINLLIRGSRQRDKLAIDIGLTILAPNYSLLANLTVLLILCSFFLPDSDMKIWIQIIAVLSLAMQILYFSLGLLLIQPTRRLFLSIMVAPVFLLWKVYIDGASLLKAKRLKWIRTRRS